MRKLFTLLAALAFALPSFAITESDVEPLLGDWTFTVYDMSGETLDMTPKNIAVTGEWIESLEGFYFVFPENQGALYVFNVTDNNDGTLTIRFQTNSASFMKFPQGYYQEDRLSIYKDGSQMSPQVYLGTYDTTEEKFTGFSYQMFPGALENQAQYLVFTATTYSNMAQTEELSSVSYAIASATKGEPEAGPSITVNLPESSCSATYTSETEAQITATPIIVADDDEDIEVYYNLYLDSTEVVPDTKIEPVDGTYKIQVGNLPFEHNYTLKVWAKAADYTSNVAQQLIFTGYAPYLTLSVTEQNVGINTADLKASFSSGNLVDGTVTYTLSATSSNGPAPESVTTTEKSATLNLTGLKGGTEYTYAVTLTATDVNGVEIKKVSNATFETEPSPEPVVSISFPEGSVTSSIQSRYYAQIIATPTIEVENADDYKVFYALYMGETKVRNDVEVAPNAEGEYVITVEELPFSRTYRLEVYVTVGDDFTSEPASVEIETVAEPGITIVSAVAENVTENSAQIVVEINPVSLGDNLTYYVGATSTSGPEVEEFATTDTSFTLNIDGLKPGEIYTYNLRVTTTVNGSMYQANKPVVITTLEASQAITLSEISYTQIPDGGAYFKVGKVDVLGFDASEVDVYFQLVGSDAAPEKAVLVTNGDESYYEYTFSGLKPFSPYQTIIFGGVGTYDSDDFFKGQEYKENFVTGQTGVDSVATDCDSNSRYFNLQGIEVKNPAAGGIYIRVNGTEVNKVIVK